MAFKRFDPEDFVVSSDSITSTLWSTGAPTLTEFYTSSVQAAGSSGNYYLSVYQTASNLSTAQVQFDIAYADSIGSGSALYNTLVPQNSYTKTIYGQYRSLILEDENASFTFGTGNNVTTGVLTATSSAGSITIPIPRLIKSSNFRFWRYNQFN